MGYQLTLQHVKQCLRFAVLYFWDQINSPCEIIGSIVKQWPGFITPTALFSEKGKKEQSKAQEVEYNSIWVQALRQALCAPYSALGYRGPVALAKFQMIPKPSTLMSSGSKKKEPRYVCLSEASSGGTMPSDFSSWNLWVLTFRHRASCILGQAFRYSPENAFYIFNQQIYFIIWYLLECASLI